MLASNECVSATFQHAQLDDADFGEASPAHRASDHDGVAARARMGDVDAERILRRDDVAHDLVFVERRKKLLPLSATDDAHQFDNPINQLLACRLTDETARAVLITR